MPEPSSSRLTHIADLLACARRNGTATVELSASALTDLASAERVRELVASALGEPVAGYKIGATSPEAQTIIGCTEPFYGSIPESAVLASGSAVALPHGVLGFECEFAFRLARDIGARPAPYSAQEVADAVDICCPAIEAVGRRTAGAGFPPHLLCVADGALNVLFVHGAPIDGWRTRDLAMAPVRGLVDGAEANRGSGAAVLGHPLNALAWLANKRSTEGVGLAAGDWISTGTCLGVITARAGQTVTGDFGALGRVELRLQ